MLVGTAGLLEKRITNTTGVVKIQCVIEASPIISDIANRKRRAFLLYLRFKSILFSCLKYRQAQVRRSGPLIISRLLTSASKIIVGKDQQLKLSLTCLIANGHLLIEDMPGMGKTTLAHVLAKLFDLSYNRVQFTSDLLPADIIGVSVYKQQENNFEFKPGPIFSQLILADEINRATPKTQSALLEAMEEGQVTMDGETYPLPQPFFVIATQNPQTQLGTFPLPESQLDRFLMRIHLGYPDPVAERKLMTGENRRIMVHNAEPVAHVEDLLALQRQVPGIHISEAVLDYIQQLVKFTRESKDFSTGLSPRGALALVHTAKAWALVNNRDHVLPEDVQAIVPAVVEHRVRGAADHTGHGGESMTEKLLATVDVISK